MAQVLAALERLPTSVRFVLTTEMKRLSMGIKVRPRSWSSMLALLALVLAAHIPCLCHSMSLVHAGNSTRVTIVSVNLTIIMMAIG